MAIALFPGQGVQAPGMDRSLGACAPAVFATASDVLGVDVLELCRTGTAGEADLSSTRWAQPAVLACSFAAFTVLVESGEDIEAAAGHSIGEYTAMVAAGVLDLADALRVVALRAKATDDAAAATPGGMAAVMRAERDAVEEVCRDTGACLAADNSSGQLVISGPLDAVEAAKTALSTAGAVCRTLEIAGAFHSTVMAPASGPLSDALDGVVLSPPRIDLWSSTSAAPMSDPDRIRPLLLDQLTSPVLWRETVEGMAQAHGPAFVDVGPGRIVGGLAKRIVAGAEIRFATDLLFTGGSS